MYVRVNDLDYNHDRLIALLVATARVYGVSRMLIVVVFCFICEDSFSRSLLIRSSSQSTDRQTDGV